MNNAIILPKAQTRLPVRSLTRPTDYTHRHGKNDLFGLYFRGLGHATWGTFWSHWEGMITAHHVIEEMKGWNPQHPDSRETVALIACPDLKAPHGAVYLDAAISGVKLPAKPPKKPEKNMRVEVWGFPAACTQAPEIRRGYVYGARLDKGQQSYIIVFDDDQVPVSGGMSGGAVYHVDSRGRKEPLGITITLNSATNLDDDPMLEDGMDFTSLYHVWAAMKGEQMRFVSHNSADELEIGEPPKEGELPPNHYIGDNGEIYVDAGTIDWANDPSIVITTAAVEPARRTRSTTRSKTSTKKTKSSTRSKSRSKPKAKSGGRMSARSKGKQV